MALLDFDFYIIILNQSILNTNGYHLPLFAQMSHDLNALVYISNNLNKKAL